MPAYLSSARLVPSEASKFITSGVGNMYLAVVRRYSVVPAIG